MGYRQCPECGAYLDPDERCECQEPPEVYFEISEQTRAPLKT